jgi:chromosome segregation ATPase
MDEQNLKKGEATIESLKRKIEVAEQEYDQKVRQLNEEKEELKRELKSLSKKGDTTEGMVNKEVLQKLTTDFQLEVDRIRREVDEERKSKVQAESTKRTLEFQIVTLKDALEQEERLKKKATLQKKQIQVEIDELKEMANEADDLNDELEKFKADADALTTELKNDMTRERNARQAAETTLLKMQREVQEIRKSLSDATVADSEQVRKLKEDYESQIVDLEDLLNREQKGKKSVGSSAKKAERDIRDMERNLQRVEKEKLQFEDRFSTLYKDTQRIKEDLQTDQKKAAQAESTNKLLIRELDNYKTKLRDLEETTQKLKEERLRKKSRPMASNRNRRAVDVSDDEDEAQ